MEMGCASCIRGSAQGDEDPRKAATEQFRGTVVE